MVGCVSISSRLFFFALGGGGVNAPPMHRGEDTYWLEMSIEGGGGGGGGYSAL